jgi:hypothetical protein
VLSTQTRVDETALRARRPDRLAETIAAILAEGDATEQVKMDATRIIE